MRDPGQERVPCFARSLAVIGAKILRLGQGMASLIPSWLKPTRLRQYEVTPHPRRWFVYGVRERASGPFPDIDEEYFVSILLPSYQWGAVDYGRRMGWLQLHVYWLGCTGFGCDWISCDR